MPNVRRYALAGPKTLTREEHRYFDGVVSNNSNDGSKPCGAMTPIGRRALSRNMAPHRFNVSFEFWDTTR